jgi:hypothetical protein
MALSYHNERRAIHNTDNLVLDTSISKFIQAAMDSNDFDGKITSKGIYSQCGENRFTNTNAASLLFTNMASQHWYTGSALYDYALGK